MKRPLLFASALAGILGACATPPPPSMTFIFNRPAGVAQVCVRIRTNAEGLLLTDSAGQFISTPEPQPLALCGRATIDPPTLDAASGQFHAFRMFGLVTQSDRGELAVVNLNPVRNSTIIDNDPTIPGFTFIPVGVFPSAIAMHPSGAAAYVANSGENTVSVVDMSTILRHDTAGSTSSVIRLAGRPSDVAVGTTAGATPHAMLYVSLPDLGQVAAIDVTDLRNIGAPQYLSLGAHVMGGLDGGLGGGGGDGGTGDAGAGGYRPERLAIATLDQATDATPGAIAHVYVTDSTAPLVHVLDAMADGSLVEMDPLTAFAPTRAITVTPTVFTAPTPRRFVYVSGAQDGALSVIDTTTRMPVAVNASTNHPECQQGTAEFDEAECPRLDPKFGLYVVPIRSAVISLATVTRDAIDGSCTTRVEPPAGVLTPPMEVPANCTTVDTVRGEGGAGVNTIQGVAVIAGVRDGTLRIVDVEDWQAYCAPDRRAGSNQGAPIAQPHMLRAAAIYPAPASLAGVVSAPAFSINGAVTAPSEADPHFASPTTDGGCTGSECVVLPTTASGVPDPSLVRDDTWTFQFEGAIPNLTVRSGAFQAAAGDEQLTAQSQGAGFCTHGALPGDIITLADPSPCAPIPSDTDAGLHVDPDPALCNGDAGAAECALTFGTVNDPCNRELRIDSVSETDLTLTPVVDNSACAVANLDVRELRRRLLQCYPQATLFNVRPRNAWTVSGAVAGYNHSVVVGSNGQCTDPMPNANPGRLIEGLPFVGPSFSVRIDSGTEHTLRDATYSFTINGGLSPLLISGALMPSSMIYSCPSRRVYVVDQARAALIEYPVAPMALPITYN